ncbi:unnamed protein product [Albugo candida]|uniref:RxLR effector protein n=1 Tax=Albugo candida TaxID=65357 RepID=A0A024FWB1_9STRA|nr:unnamed protein product [Albugo candida]|eukprot:CCI11207.1 unnamed protein product [Albugo candida]
MSTCKSIRKALLMLFLLLLTICETSASGFLGSRQELGKFPRFKGFKMPFFSKKKTDDPSKAEEDKRGMTGSTVSWTKLAAEEKKMGKKARKARDKYDATQKRKNDKAVQNAESYTTIGKASQAKTMSHNGEILTWPTP